MSAPGKVAFPEALRIHGASGRFEAAGRRAYAAEREAGILDIRIEGRRAVLHVPRPDDDSAVATWPFAASRASELLFVAPDQPVVLYQTFAHCATPVRLDGDSGMTLALEHVGAGVRAVVYPADVAVPDVDALIASATARARRRATQRPVLTGQAGDPFARAEHGLRIDLARDGNAGAPSRVAAALALLALNDEDTALHALREAGSVEWTGDEALIVVGAWAAWRGTAIPHDALRDAARGALDSRKTRGDRGSWSDAEALAPFAADVLASTPSAAPSAAERASAVAADPLRAIIDAGRASPSAAAVLEAMHGDLGVMPDAIRARVRLAPRLDPGTTTAERIAVGDALFAIDARVDAESASIVIEQTHGPTPYRAILEPRLPARRLRGATVDGMPAELDAAFEGGALRVSVQIVVDQIRTLVLDYERR